MAFLHLMLLSVAFILAAAVCDTGSEFRCQSDGFCIPRAWHCDGNRDCLDFSDENECTEILCPLDMFKCQPYDCIPGLWRCDGQWDCNDGSDESAATCAESLQVSSCSKNQFACPGSEPPCIPNAWICDLDSDCSDGADEVGCPTATCDNTLHFQCTSSQECILKRWLCDGDFDCRDESDEAPEICPDLMATSLPCPSGMRTCSNRKCILANQWCDGNLDCSDGSDEADCEATCPPDELTCNDGSCQLASARCDGIQDCPDNSDEVGCPEDQLACVWPNAFKCPNNPACVQISGVCDGIDDCINGEDETECTPQPCREDNGGCGDRRCLVVPNGFFCECGTGYQFTLFGCSDINECEQTSSPCPGIDCINLQPGFNCSCPHPNYYVDTDGRTCRFTFPTPPVLLTSSHGRILELTVLQQGIDVYADAFQNVVSIAYDPKTDDVYVSDFVEGDIRRISKSDLGISQQVIADGSTASSMAFDWIYRNLYWVDDAQNTINVAPWDGRYKKTLISRGLDKPRAIIVDPQSRSIYWSNGGEMPYIARAALDGGSVLHLISNSLGLVDGLAQDYDGQRLYWIDAKFCRLESSDLDGNNRRVILEISCPGEDMTNHFLSLAVFQDTLYWTSAVDSHVFAANKFNGKGLQRLFNLSDAPGSLTLKNGYYDALDHCSQASISCSHLCLQSQSAGTVCACPDNSTLAVDKRTCLCSNGDRLADDGITCVEENFCRVTPDPCRGLECVSTPIEATCFCPRPEYHLVKNKEGPTCLFSNPTPPDILLANGRLVRFIDTLFGLVKATISGFISATVITYDWLYFKEAMYVSDTSSGTIIRIEFANGVEGNRTVIVSNATSVLGVAFDDVHRYLYWSDSRKGTISVTPWDGGFSKVILSRDEGTSVPRALALDPQHGYLFWTDYTQRYAFIGRAGLDGSNPEQIVTQDLQWPISLVHDPSQDKLYWLDLGSKTLHSSKTDGSRRLLLMRDISRRPFGLVVHQDRVYWTDGTKGSIFSANKFSGTDLQVVVKDLRRPMGIVSVEPTYYYDSLTVANACQDPVNNCSHFCFGVPTTANPLGFACACPGGYSRLSDSDVNQCVCLNGTRLLSDGVTCEVQTTDCPHGVPGLDGECEGSTQTWCNATDPIPCPGVECLNQPSGPECVCPHRFGLDTDGRTCLYAYPTRPVILVAGFDRLLRVDMMTLSPADTITDIEGDWMSSNSVVYDFESRYMFVGNNGKSTLERYTTSGRFFYENLQLNNPTVLSATANSTEGMSCDWVHRNLYWVDTHDQTIKVVPYDGRWPPSVVLRGLDKPRGIVVDPRQRYMYYTEWGASPKIGKAGLDGTSPSTLVDSDIVWPNGLTLDYQADRLYWVDSWFDHMEYIGLDGHGRRILIENEDAMRHPFGIGIYEDRVYWGDWKTTSLSSANKFTGERIQSVSLAKAPMFLLVSGDGDLHFISVIPNHCRVNHGCSHLCLPSPTNFTCACPQTAHLDIDNATCLCRTGRPLLRDGVNCEEPPVLLCERNKFQCVSDGSCIPLWQTCDGYFDCPDQSDENCNGGCGDWGYQCHNRSCIHTWQRCDGIPGDCGDSGNFLYEDELDCEHATDWCNADPNPCPGVECLNLLTGPLCQCPQGYNLDSDGRTCVHANPTEPLILVTTGSHLLSLDPSLDDVTDIFGDWKDVRSVIYSPGDSDMSGSLFVANAGKMVLERFTTLGGFHGTVPSVVNRTVLSTSVKFIEGLAYDWIQGNLYWVDVSDRSIKVVPSDGRWPSAVVLGQLDAPMDVAVHPGEMYMYWTSWGATSSISKAGLDGSRPAPLVTANIVQPSGLALDYEARRVYWVDSILVRMEYVDLDGSGRHILIQNSPSLRHPFRIAIYEDKIYWGDWVNKDVSYANKFTGELMKSVHIGVNPMYISLISPPAQGFQGVNYCGGDHGCSHLCLPSPFSPTNFTCACPLNITHLDNNKTCLCGNQQRLLDDGVSCDLKSDKELSLPIRVEGLTSTYLEEREQSQYINLRCTITKEEVVCVPEDLQDAEEEQGQSSGQSPSSP